MCGHHGTDKGSIAALPQGTKVHPARSAANARYDSDNSSMGAVVRSCSGRCGATDDDPTNGRVFAATRTAKPLGPSCSRCTRVARIMPPWLTTATVWPVWRASKPSHPCAARASTASAGSPPGARIGPRAYWPTLPGSAPRSPIAWSAPRTGHICARATQVEGDGQGRKRRLLHGGRHGALQVTGIDVVDGPRFVAGARPAGEPRPARSRSGADWLAPRAGRVRSKYSAHGG